MPFRNRQITRVIFFISFFLSVIKWFEYISPAEYLKSVFSRLRKVAVAHLSRERKKEKIQR